MVSILKDTLGDGDPTNDRIRYVYAFGYTRPTVFQRLSAAVPFLYRRAGLDFRQRPAPTPLIDMAAPAKGTSHKVAAALLQSSVLDPLGMPWRASTRAYRSRTGEYREMHVNRALEVMRALPAGAAGLSESELNRVEGRLVLSNQALGGLVREQSAPSAWTKRRGTSSVNRAHNWELLRQRAEENGLVFEPLRIGSEEINFAMLWVREDEPARSFDGKFLGIQDPYRDSRIRTWSGYHEVSETGAGTKIIPLAVYALDHPKVPLLLIDFRAPGKLKRREMALRFTDELTTGVLGLTGWGNIPYAAGKNLFFFVRGRWGSTLNRQARVRAYAQFRQALLMDSTLPAARHNELVRNLDRLGWNTFEEGIAREIRMAEGQYQALLDQTDGRLPGDMERQRLHEIRGEIHSTAARAGLRLASLATLGMYRHRDALTPERVAAVAQLRRDAFEKKERSAVAALPPPAPVVDMIRAGGE